MRIITDAVTALCKPITKQRHAAESAGKRASAEWDHLQKSQLFSHRLWLVQAFIDDICVLIGQSTDACFFCKRKRKAPDITYLLDFPAQSNKLQCRKSAIRSCLFTHTAGKWNFSRQQISRGKSFQFWNSFRWTLSWYYLKFVHLNGTKICSGPWNIMLDGTILSHVIFWSAMLNVACIWYF